MSTGFEKPKPSPISWWWTRKHLERYAHALEDEVAWLRWKEDLLASQIEGGRG